MQDVLEDSKASYAYVRVKYANDKESQREKFILVVWIGSGCGIFRKAKVCSFLALPSFTRVLRLDESVVPLFRLLFIRRM